jgi:hypothetical protein
MSDHESENTDGKTTLLTKELTSRRSFLAATAGVAGVVAFGGTASAAEDYETIVVPEDTYEVFNVGDGESFTNKLIDISADGAMFQIDAEGSDWEVRNIGVKGTWDDYSDGHQQAIAAKVDDGSVGVIENYYFADAIPDSTYPGVTGIYVSRTHAGTLKINNVNLQHFPNNAIYASTPGYPEDNPKRPVGYQGVVEITNSFAADCKASHFRLGTDGSFLKNCVAVGGDRGFWSKFNDTEVIDCDFHNHSQNSADGDIVCGTNNYPSGDEATVTLENTTFGHSAPGDQDITYDGTIYGSSADRAARTSPPAGVPRSAEEAASGATSDTSSGTGDSSDDTSGSDTETPHTLAVEAVDDSGWGEYTFTTSGPVVRSAAANDSDSIADNGDGTYTVSGVVGNGGLDDFEFAGELVSWSCTLDASQYTLTVDGQAVDPANYGDDSGSSEETQEPTTHTLAVEAASDSGWGAYEFTTKGAVTRNASANDSDSIVENDDGTYTVSGVVGNGGLDDFEFTGELLAWSSEFDESEYTLVVDGQAVDPANYGDTSGGSGETDEETQEPTTHTLAIEAADDSGWGAYEFTTKGAVTRNASANDSDSIVENDDGTYTVSGVVGNGGLDDFEFTGELLAWSSEFDASQYTLTVDGQAVDPVNYGDTEGDDSGSDSGSSEPVTHELRLEAADDSGWGQYVLRTEGEITKGSSANGVDDVSQNDDGTWTVQGIAGNGGLDDFTFVGGVESWSSDFGADELTIVVDGETLSESEFRSL